MHKRSGTVAAATKQFAETGIVLKSGPRGNENVDE